MRSCLASVLLAAALVAACVRNPVPERPAEHAPPPADAPPVPSTTRRAPYQHLFPAAGRRVVPLFLPGEPQVRTWRGLRLASRERCPGYDPALYAPVRHASRLPDCLARGWRDPLTCSWFGGPADPHIVPARIVPPGVAQDAGLCGAGPALRRAFAFDPENTVYLPGTVAALRRYLARRRRSAVAPLRQPVLVRGGAAPRAPPLRPFGHSGGGPRVRGCPADVPGLSLHSVLRRVRDSSCGLQHFPTSNRPIRVYRSGRRTRSCRMAVRSCCEVVRDPAACRSRNTFR